MIRTAFAAMLAAGAALGGVWLAAAPSAAMPEALAATELVEVPTIAVPVFAEDRVRGYFLLRLALEARSGALDALAVPATSLLVDAVIAHVFANPDLPFATPDRFELEPFRESLREALDRRSGGGIVALHVTQIDFLSKSEIRENAIGRRAPLQDGSR